MKMEQKEKMVPELRCELCGEDRRDYLAQGQHRRTGKRFYFCRQCGNRWEVEE